MAEKLLKGTNSLIPELCKALLTFVMYLNFLNTKIGPQNELETLLASYKVNFTPYLIKSVCNSL